MIIRVLIDGQDNEIFYFETTYLKELPFFNFKGLN